MKSDEELMTAYVAGDPAAFQELFVRYAEVLVGMLRRRVDDDHSAQDLVQQTFLQFHRARFDFKPGSQVRPWLFTIALNLARGLSRTKVRRRERALEVDPASDLTPVSHELESRESAQRVHECLDALPDQQREVIELHWFEGISFAEISLIVGASLSAVKVRAHRGYEQLREALGPERGRTAAQGVSDGLS